MKVGIRIVHCSNVRTGGRHDLTNISLYRLGDGYSFDRHDPDCAVEYVEEVTRCQIGLKER